MKTLLFFIIALFTNITIVNAQFTITRPVDSGFVLTVDSDTVSERRDKHKIFEDCINYSQMFPESKITILPTGETCSGFVNATQDTTQLVDTVFVDNTDKFINPSIIQNVEWTHKRDVDSDSVEVFVSVESEGNLSFQYWCDNVIEKEIRKLKKKEDTLRTDCKEDIVFRVSSTYNVDELTRVHYFHEEIIPNFRPIMPDINIADAVSTKQGSTFTPSYDLPLNVVAGDLLLLVVNVKSANINDGIDTAPADLTQQEVAIDNSTWSPNHYVYWKVAEASDESRATFDFTLRDDWQSSSVAYRITDYDSANPIGQSTSTSTSNDVTSITASSITVEENSLVILSGGLGGFSNTVDEMTAPAGWVDEVKEPKTSSSDIGTHTVSQIFSAGATGDQTWTWTGAQPASASMIEIRAATATTVSLSDSINLGESFQVNNSSEESDQINSSESQSINSNISQNDLANLLSSISISQQTDQSDIINVADNLFVSSELSSSESISLSDAIELIQQVFVSDNANLLDQVDVIKEIIKSVSDSFSSSEVLSISNNISLSDQFSIADFINNQAVVNVNDTADVIDTINVIKEILKSVNDSILLSDELSASNIFSLNDLISSSDIVLGSVNFNVSDNLSAQEQIDVFKEILKSINDTVELSSSISLTSDLSDSDSLSFSDLVQINTSFSIQDNISLEDQISVLKQALKIVSDSLSFNDQLNISTNITGVDSGNLSEVISLINELSINDELSIIDTATAFDSEKSILNVKFTLASRSYKVTFASRSYKTSFSQRSSKIKFKLNS